jgi:hypothetical protein
LCASTTEVFASSPLILSMRDRAEVIDKLLSNKIDTVLPQLMRREGIDMWVVVSREYNEDPIIKTMLPATWHAARRRTILVMFDPGEGKQVETIAVSRYKVGERFDSAWDKEEEPDQWKRFAEIVVERKPKKIGINQSEHWGLACQASTANVSHLLNDWRSPGWRLARRWRCRYTHKFAASLMK